MGNILIDSFNGFLEKIGEFLPNLFTCIALVIAGVIIGRLLQAVIFRTAVFLKMDSLSERLGIEQILRKCGFKDSLSKFIAKIIFWIVFISFIVIGLDTLRMPAVEDLLSEFLLYLPNVILSLVIILIGYLLGNFLGRAALIASVNAGLAFSGLVGRFVKFTVFTMAASMALEILGIGEYTVLIAFAIVFGGVVLALSIAFGLGGRDAAKDYIDKMLKEKKEDNDIRHI